MSAKSSGIPLIRDFYLILIGIVISYFVGVTIKYNNIASPIVLLEWVGNHIFNEGTSPTPDSIVRSFGVTVVPVVFLFVFGIAWQSYESFLKHLERGGKRIRIGIELPFVSFLGVSPIGLLLLFSPSEALASYPIMLMIERFGVSTVTIVYVAFFFFRIRTPHRSTTAEASST